MYAANEAEMTSFQTTYEELKLNFLVGVTVWFGFQTTYEELKPIMNTKLLETTMFSFQTTYEELKQFNPADEWAVPAASRLPMRN
ncbi:conserved protein of unknown function [Mesotoga infera]|uniref:Uncharacterized protein n=1 Tax=Mesotoga infera TaxID=1236046 RepID=A0A7Z7PRD6_9BACT|nr:conserved protein of unknown function [Mesotoga infera]